MEGVEFRVLGPFELAVDGRVVEIGSPKQRALLTALTLHRCQVVPAEALADALWAGRPPASAGSTVRSLVARVRKVLAGAGVPAGAAVVRGRGSGYVLETDAARVDAERFAACAARAGERLAAGSPEEAHRELGDGLALWRGAAYADLAGWGAAEAEARRLDERRLAAVEDLAEAELGLGRPADAAAGLEAHVAAHPLRERPWAQLMVARYRLDHQAEALATYRRVRAVLDAELGVEPGPLLRATLDRILRQGPGPAREAAHDLGLSAGPAAALPAGVSSFVGRAEELAALDGLARGARLLTVTGVGGVGKTRLALRWAAGVATCPVRLVELAAVRDPEHVAGAIAAGIGYVPGALAAGGVPLLAALCAQLRDRALLLVLDTCEHLVAAVSRAVHALLQSCPRLTVLATSREVLGLPGEWSTGSRRCPARTLPGCSSNARPPSTPGPARTPPTWRGSAPAWTGSRSRSSSRPRGRPRWA